ncbi:hypothetical protein N780_13190 [Pontibacillus chungwhensis BH030062]|uniref:Uncharacterized protein n=1 Tax=Pontibacillus chungwhensis BH030062 TaxID=1385513 RepID=A0A0A2VI93_9BACI|nr:hypothetical protein [Pontibacillus chungwhensis]KGP93310.1 hypothetical protein N780_13190 [Pontibacillus chungwhensis BH030062]
MSNKKRNEDHQMSEAFTANSKISKAFSGEDHEDGGMEGENLSQYYMYNNTPAIDIDPLEDTDHDTEDQVKNKE